MISKIKNLFSHRVQNSEGEMPANYRPECDTQFVEVRGNKIAMIQDFGEGVKVIAHLDIDCASMNVGDEEYCRINSISVEELTRLAWRAENCAAGRRRERRRWR